jgi:CubicO group peptidase (beta-lactamase class C family)
MSHLRLTPTFTANHKPLLSVATVMKIARLLFVLVLAVAASPQTRIPDTPAARQFAAWLEAFNSGDRAKLLAYLQKNYPARAGNIDGEMGFRNNTGGFEFKKVEQSTPQHFSGLVKERGSDQFARFDLEVEPAAPYRISKFELRAMPQPAEFATPRISEAEAISALRARLDKDAAADRFSGAVLVAKNGNTIFEQAYGMADLAAKIPNKITTRFRIGSMNKMFTAVAILQLVQQGKIALTDTLGKFLPDYPNHDIASKVTIHTLLTHTGGTGDIFGPEFDAHRTELKTLDDYVALYGKRGLAFEPGSRWAYSNYGFVLLGVIIEKVSGQSYYDFVDAQIFKPAGMLSTGSLPEEQNVPDLSVGYTRESPTAPWTPNTDTLPYRGTSAGGGYSTVEYLLRFANALTSLKLLDDKHFALLTTGKVDTPQGSKYAYGFQDQSSGSVRCFGHGGGAPGMNGDLVICPESAYVIAVLANMDPPAAGRISQFISNRLPEK